MAKVSRSATTLLISGHECERETIVPFASYCLNCRSTHTRLSGEQRIQLPHSLDARIAAAGIQYRSVTHNVIDNNETTAARKLQCPRKVSGIVRLVSVNENQVKWAASLGRELRQGI
jgi:hypothetical protein